MVYIRLCKDNLNNAVETAVHILRKSGLIIFPTETVYGIGAVMNDRNAIKKLFIAKKRPKGKPFQVLISDPKDINRLCSRVPLKAKQLMKKSWPGPLTVVLKKKRSVPGLVTGGLNTVGIRMPDHPFILSVIKKLGRPIAASSANTSGKRPPKTAKEAMKYFRNKTVLVIDAGRVIIGKPSAVVDATGPHLKYLRK